MAKPAALTTARRLRLTQALAYSLGLIWAGLALRSWLRPPLAMAGWLVGMMAGSALIFGGLGYFLGARRGRRRWWLLALVWVGLNLILTVADEFGYLDLLTGLLNLGLFGLLIVYRRIWWELAGPPGGVDERES